MTHPPKDTVRIAAPAAAGRCGRARLGLLVHGSEGGNGVMVWLRPGDSFERGEFPLLPRGDSVTARGATVVVRFAVDNVVHGAVLDSGAVSVTQADDPLALRARGSGADIALGVSSGRVTLDAAFDAVPVGRDTVACQVPP